MAYVAETGRYQISDDVQRSSSRASGASRCLTPRDARGVAARASPTPDLDEEDPEVELLLAAARSRRGVRLYPFNIHAKSVVDQVVFNHDLDQSNDDQFDTQHFKAMFQDAAGRPSWKDQLRCKQQKPRKMGDPWGPIEDPRTMPIVPGGRRKFPGPVSKSVVDDILFGRDLDGSGTERDRFYAMEALHTGAAGTPSWLQRKELGLPASFAEMQRRRLKQRRAMKHTCQLSGSATARQSRPKEATPAPVTRLRACSQRANALPLAVAKAFALMETGGRREAWE